MLLVFSGGDAMTSVEMILSDPHRYRQMFFLGKVSSNVSSYYPEKDSDDSTIPQPVIFDIFWGHNVYM